MKITRRILTPKQRAQERLKHSNLRAKDLELQRCTTCHKRPWIEGLHTCEVCRDKKRVGHQNSKPCAPISRDEFNRRWREIFKPENTMVYGGGLGK